MSSTGKSNILINIHDTKLSHFYFLVIPWLNWFGCCFECDPQQHRYLLLPLMSDCVPHHCPAPIMPFQEEDKRPL